MKSLTAFSAEVKPGNWYCFDMGPLQKAINKGTLSISDKMLASIIKGYDLLVIIPEVTADGF